jgi:hypothetical protein
MKPISIVAATLILSTQLVMAKTQTSPNWNNVEVNFITIDLEDNEIKPQGFNINGSYQFYNNYFTKISYSKATEKENGIEFKNNAYSLGIGNKLSLSRYTDLYASISYDYTETNKIDIDGLSLTVGARYMLNDSLELAGNVVNLISNSESNFRVNLNAQYLINDEFSVGVGYSIDSEAQTSNVGLRYSF